MEQTFFFFFFFFLNSRSGSYDGAKLFNLSGIEGNRYPKADVMNLARFISVMKVKFRQPKE